MRPFIRVLRIAAPCAVLACSKSSSPSGPTATVDHVDVSPSRVNIAVGANYQLTATPRDASNAVVNTPVTWRSSDPTVLTVSGSGMVHGVATGPAGIAAEAGGTAGASVVLVAGSPTFVIKRSGDLQTATAGSALGSPLVVTVTDAQGYPIAGANVTWTVPAGSGHVSPISVATDSAGDAHTSWTLGNGGTNSVTASVTGATSAGFTATATIALLAAPRVGAGLDDSCAIDAAGNTWCWGEAIAGETGDSSAPTLRHLSPVQVHGNHAFLRLTGGDGACGLINTGEAWCWGENEHGGVGDGTQVNRPVPFAVAGGILFNVVSGAQERACAISAGAAYCWGSNHPIGGGPGSTGANGDDTFVDAPAPVAVHGGLSFKAISAGPTETCGLTQSGAAYCWGFAYQGSLGNGSSVQDSIPHPVAVSGGHTFTAIATGGSFACALDTSGLGWCWGAPGYLGLGTFKGSTVPARIGSSVAFTQISASLVNVCALTSAGVAYCWGDNSVGAIGNGKAASGYGVYAVSGGSTFSEISVGQQHVCARGTDHKMYCWGSNWTGQLGDGTSTERDVPTPVAGAIAW